VATSDTLAFSELVQPTLLQVPQCPEAVAIVALRQAIRDFYRDTGVWLEDLQPIMILEDLKSYRVVEPRDWVIIEALQELRIDPDRMRGFNWVFELPDTLTITSETPKDETILTPRARLNLTFSGNKVLSMHADRWAHVWEHGALWYLRQQGGQPWYNLEDGEYHRNQFRMAINQVKNQMQRDFTGRDLRAKPHPFIFGGRIR